MEARDASIVSQVAAKAATELVVARIAAGIIDGSVSGEEILAEVSLGIAQIATDIGSAADALTVVGTFPGAVPVAPPAASPYPNNNYPPPQQTYQSPPGVVPVPGGAPPPPPPVAPPPQPAGAGGATYLNVPIQQKDAAKGMGARWDPDRKKWYVPVGVDPSPFSLWFN